MSDHPDEALSKASWDVGIAASMLNVVYLEIEANADYTEKCRDRVPEIRRRSIFALTHDEILALDHAISEVRDAADNLSRAMEEKLLDNIRNKRAKA